MVVAAWKALEERVEVVKAEGAVVVDLVVEGTVAVVTVVAAMGEEHRAKRRGGMVRVTEVEKAAGAWEEAVTALADLVGVVVATEVEMVAVGMVEEELVVGIMGKVARVERRWRRRGR